MRTRIAVVGRWGGACGMDNYVRDFARHAAKSADVTILCEDSRDSVCLEDELGVRPAWSELYDGPAGIEPYLHADQTELVHVQFNWGFLPLELVEDVCRIAQSNHVPVIVQVHAARDPAGRALSELVKATRSASLLLAHSEADVVALRDAGAAPVRLWGLGEELWSQLNHAILRSRLHIDGRGPVVSTFGFLQPRKGTLELIEAIGRLRVRFPDVLLLAANALHSRSLDSDYYFQCHDAIRSRGLESSVRLVSDYLPESASMVLLMASDLVVLPYRDTLEGSSAALKFVAASGKPVLVSDCPIFSQFPSHALRIEDVSADGIGGCVERVLNDPELLADLARASAEYSRRSNWDVLMEEYWSMAARVTGAES